MSLDPEGANEQLHFNQLAAVYILKRVLKNISPLTYLNDPNVGPDERPTFKRAYAEFLLPTSDKQVLEYAESASEEDMTYDYYVLHQVSSPIDDTAGTLGGGRLTNDHVESIQVTTSVEGASSANVVLRNESFSFTFTSNPLLKGKCVIEPNDQILIYLPGATEGLYRAFSGFVNSVSDQVRLAGSPSSTISLECEGMLKLLRQSRTNVVPSVNVQEAGGQEITPYTARQAGQSVTEVVTDVLTEATANYQSSVPFSLEVKKIRAQANVQSKLSVGEKANLVIQSINALRRRYKKDFIEKLSDGTLLGFRLVTLIPFDNPVSLLFRGGVRLGLTERLLSNPFRVLNSISFFVQGTTQPAFQMMEGSGNPNFFQSSYESSLAFLQKIAKTINFELYDTPEGIIVFRPLNTTLPSSNFPLKVLFGLDDRPADVYYSNSALIQTETFKESDENIFTMQYVQGVGEFATDVDKINFATVTDSMLFAKFGARTAPLATRINLRTDDDLIRYGSTLLTRQNSKYRTGTITQRGDARIRAGNPFYVQHRETVYYISKVSHVYIPSKFTTELTLTYGRRPLALYSPLIPFMFFGELSPVNLLHVNTWNDVAVLSRMKLSGALSQTVITKGGLNLSVSGILSAIGAKKAFTLYDWYEQEISSGNLVFNGKVWEGLPDIDLTENRFTQNLGSTAVAKIVFEEDKLGVAWKDGSLSVRSIGELVLLWVKVQILEKVIGQGLTE